MDLGIKGKTALVTGSTKGIGFAIASALLQEGALVTINGRTQKAVDQALQSLKKFGTANGIVSDLSTAEGAAATIKQLPAVEILVNNVGAYEPKEFSQITDADWENIFQVNVMSGVRLSRHYLPLMLKENWGRVIFISSESAVQTPVEMIHYGFTKTAQLAISRGLAETTKGTNVTVNSVLPGPTLSEGVTDFVANMGKQKNISTQQVEKEFFENVRPSSLIQRFATSEEVASMVCYVASTLASATNGAALRVDGGVVRSIV
ncbi:MAG: SDR family NAD(P)-dependent oxidoreductase [Candidatus Obscuribacterales bacterium]|nr:SDR family NAD(P)-dependent oxidoreductase [Candidatus Obscuribacterales bacterium]